MQGLDAQSLKSVSDEIMQAVDAAENLEALDAIRVNVLGKKGRISLLMRELGGMDADARKTAGQALNIVKDQVADALEAASPFENVHDKLLIDATTLVSTDPRSSDEPLEGSYNQPTPAWRQGSKPSEPFTGLEAVTSLPGVRQARMLRDNMLVVSTSIEGTPSPRTGQHEGNDEQEGKRIDQIIQLRNSIWQLDSEKNLRWLFITNDDLDMTHTKARRRLLWQLTSRFDVGRGLTFDDDKSRLCWDATTPIPSEEHGVRRWPAITLHDEETLAKVASHPELSKYEWPPHLSFGGPE